MQTLCREGYCDANSLHLPGFQDFILTNSIFPRSSSLAANNLPTGVYVYFLGGYIIDRSINGRFLPHNFSCLDVVVQQSEWLVNDLEEFPKFHQSLLWHVKHHDILRESK